MIQKSKILSFIQFSGICRSSKLDLLIFTDLGLGYWHLNSIICFQLVVYLYYFFIYSHNTFQVFVVYPACGVIMNKEKLDFKNNTRT